MIQPPAASQAPPPTRANVAPVRWLAGLGAALIVALPPAMWLANRSATLMLGLAALALVLAGVGAGLRPILMRMRANLLTPVGLALGFFLLWALVSLAWSHRPMADLAMWGELALPVLCGLVLVASAALRVDVRLQRALAWALLATALLIMLELATGLGQRVALGLGKGANRTDVFNRPVLTCLLLAAAALPGLWSRPGASRRDRILAGCAAAAIAAAILVSESGAARLGLLIMVAVGGLTLVAPRVMLAAVAFGFAATMLLSPLLGEIADRAIPGALHQRLADSHSRDRVDIWLSFGDVIFKHPIAGTGFGTTAAMSSHPVALQIAPQRQVLLAVGHPHSAPIQAWAETGLVGAALLAFAGLACLMRLGRLAAPALAPRLALFSAAFAVASVGHGAWQGWWIAALATAAALLWLDDHDAQPHSLTGPEH